MLETEARDLKSIPVAIVINLLKSGYKRTCRQEHGERTTCPIMSIYTNYTE